MKKQNKKVLVACEESQVICKAFREKGYEAFSCDLQECSGGKPEWHLQCDVRTLFNEYFDLVIFHPTCTFLSNSGVRWLKGNPQRWEDMTEACKFFNMWKCFNSPRIAIENPIPHKYAVNNPYYPISKYDQIIQPWQFGHGETKATCLWLKGLPKLIPTNIVDGREQRIWKLPPSKDRAKLRSKTYEGIAKAMVDQWGTLI